MDWHPIQGGVTILLGMLQATETGVSSGRVGLWPMCPFTLPYKLYIAHKISICSSEAKCCFGVQPISV